MSYVNNGIFFLLAMLSSHCFATEKYTMNPAQGLVTWHISQSKSKAEAGQLPVEATLLLDPDNATQNSLEGKMELSKITTGDSAIDSEFQALSSLNENYAYAYFKSNKIVFSDNNTAKIYGNIILLGIHIPVVVNTHLNRIALSSLSPAQTIVLSASTSIKPSRFPAFLIPKNISTRDNVEIKIDASLRSAG